MMLQVPLAAGAEVVVHGDSGELGVAKQAIDEVAADESGAADEEPAASSLSVRTPNASPAAAGLGG